MNLITYLPILEAMIFASTVPLSVMRCQQLLAQQGVQLTLNDIQIALQQLAESYESRGVELVEVASGFRFQVKQDYAHWITQLWQEKPSRYSRATLETLALIAYRQPITRSEIEAVRGVAVSSAIINSLVEREWIRVVGQRDMPGKPHLYGTTKLFLDYFNLKQLADLPPLTALTDLDDIAQQMELNWNMHQVQQGDAEAIVHEVTEQQDIGLTKGEVNSE